MKSKKIIFAFVFLLQIHGASAGQSDKKIDTNKDPVEKRDELDQQSPKAPKEVTLEDLLNEGQDSGHAPKAQEEQKFDQGDKNQDFASSPSQSSEYKSYGGEGGEDQMDDSYGTPEVSCEYEGGVSSDSQSDGGRGRGEEEGRGSITSLDAQKSDPDSSEDKESSYAPIDKNKSDDVQGGKDSCTKQSKLSAQQESDHEGKELDHKNHKHSDEEEKNNSNCVVKKTSRKKQPRQ